MFCFNVHSGDEVFSHLQAKLQTSDSRILWQLLDKRQSQQEYYNSNNERACSGKQVSFILHLEDIGKGLKTFKVNGQGGGGASNPGSKHDPPACI